MLDMVDEGRLPMRPAVELSYLPHEQQQMLLDVIEAEERTPSHAQAAKMRKHSDDGRLDYNTIQSIMREHTLAAEHFKMPRESIQRFFPLETSAKTIEETIIKALELWHKSRQ
jgi:ParB family chromosome partitioning protein